MRRYLTFWNLLGLLVFVLGVAAMLHVSRPPRTDVVNLNVTESSSQEPVRAQLRLYFANADATGFVIEKRDVTLLPGESVYQRALAELVKGPRQVGEPLVPPDVPVPTVFVSGRSAYVDLPKEYGRLGYGTTGETLLIYGIANTLLDQGPLDEVWFLIGGEPARTLGHLSLVEPIRRNR
ncbi:GerMN domain-containing protein [Oceanithermus sp.]